MNIHEAILSVFLWQFENLVTYQHVAILQVSVYFVDGCKNGATLEKWFLPQTVDRPELPAALRFLPCASLPMSSLRWFLQMILPNDHGRGSQMSPDELRGIQIIPNDPT